MGSPEIHPFGHSSKEKRSEYVRLDSVKESDRFIAKLLAPAVAKRYGVRPPGKWDEREAAADAKSDYDCFGLFFERGPTSKSPTEYVISAVKVEPLNFKDDPGSWKLFAEMINTHPAVLELMDDEGEDADESSDFIDVDTDPSNYALLTKTTKEFSFHYGRRVTNNVSHSFIVEGIEFSLGFDDEPPAERRRIEKGMSGEEKYLTAKDWEVTGGLSTEEMQVLFEALEALDLYRSRRKTSFAIPKF